MAIKNNKSTKLLAADFPKSTQKIIVAKDREGPEGPPGKTGKKGTRGVEVITITNIDSSPYNADGTNITYVINVSPCVIVLPESPATGTSYKFLDNTGNGFYRPVDEEGYGLSIDGNGYSISGWNTWDFQSYYGSAKVIFNGTMWNIEAGLSRQDISEDNNNAIDLELNRVQKALMLTVGNITTASSPYQMTDNFYVSSEGLPGNSGTEYVGVKSYNGAVVVRLPVSAHTGRRAIIKDEDGYASTNSITVQCMDGYIDGYSTYDIEDPYGFVSLVKRSSWQIIAKSYSSVYWDFDFTTYTPGTIATPSEWTFTRANHTGSRLTVQTSTSTVADLGEGADFMRIGQFGSDANSRGLVMEELIINYVNFPFSLTAFTGDSGMTATVNYGAIDGILSPWGDTKGWRCQLTSGGYSGKQGSGYAHAYFSFWARATTTTKRQTAKAGTVVFDDTIDTTWRRVYVGDSLGGDCYPSDAGGQTGLTGARDTVVDMFQIENQPHPTEWVRRNDGTQGQRNKETLTLADGSVLVNNNRISLMVEFIPKGSSAQYLSTYITNAYILENAGGSVSVYISPTTKLLNIVCGGTTWTNAVAMSWSMQDTIQLFFEAGGGSVVSKAWYRTKPKGSSTWGSTISLGTGTVQATPAALTAVKFMCGSGYTFSCWLQRIEAYRSGTKPDWAV